MSKSDNPIPADPARRGSRVSKGSAAPPKKMEPSDDFGVVGIGASAGGLEAFSEVLRTLPADTGMAFVLVMHLDPNHQSLLAEVLSNRTAMPVLQIQDKMAVKPNHVYVIPPNVTVELTGRKLLLSARMTKGVHNPVDIFFISLAREMGPNATGVILSGTASDGTLGLKEIKAAAGVTFCQDESAKYDGMPREPRSQPEWWISSCPRTR